MIAPLTLLKQISLAAFGIAPGNYSGITHIADNQYAIVSDHDKTDGFMLLTLDMDPVSASITGASLCEPEGMAARRKAGSGVNRDCEGIAFYESSGTLFISGEEDQRILEYTLDGTPTGRALAVPSNMGRSKIRSNYGFEALSYNANTATFWTATETTLQADGECTTLKNRNVHNRIRLQAFDANLQPVAQYAYEMDLPKSRGNDGTFVHGVSSILALDDGRLIVMEREAYIPSLKLGSFCHVKLYVVQPKDKNKVIETESLASVSKSLFMKKELLTEFTTNLSLMKMDFANYEGMCLGPKLSDGRQTLLLISDSQKGAGNSLFRLKDYIRVLILD